MNFSVVHAKPSSASGSGAVGCFVASAPRNDNADDF